MVAGFIDTVTLNAASTVAAGVGGDVDARGCTVLAVYQTGVGTISGGALVIETAADSGYAGTWSQVLTLDPTDVSGGKTQGIALPTGAYNWLRGRITTDLTGGGTITVRVVGS